MNNPRLLTGLLFVILSSGGLCCYGQSVITLEDIFRIAETNNTQLKPSFTAQADCRRELS